jgi:hypothetical protein
MSSSFQMIFHDKSLIEKGLSILLEMSIKIDVRFNFVILAILFPDSFYVYTGNIEIYNDEYLFINRRSIHLKIRCT